MTTKNKNMVHLKPEGLIGKRPSVGGFSFLSSSRSQRKKTKNHFPDQLVWTELKTLQRCPQLSGLGLGQR
jgi:hypothetical protein